MKILQSLLQLIAGTMGILYFLIFFGMGFLQLVAIVGGIETWWGWPRLVSIFFGFPVGDF